MPLGSLPIDICKTYTNNIFLKTMMAKSTTRCQCGSTSNRICCSRADFHKPVPSARINPISRSCTPFITDTTRQHALEGRAAAFWLCWARRKLRLGLLARGAPAIHAPAGEAGSHRLNRFCCHDAELRRAALLSICAASYL